VGIAAGRIERTRVVRESMEAARARRGMRTKLAHLEIAGPEPTVQIEGKTVWFVRHGQSAANAASEEERAGPGTPSWHPESPRHRRRACCEVADAPPLACAHDAAFRDAPLTELGIQQATALQARPGTPLASLATLRDPGACRRDAAEMPFTPQQRSLVGSLLCARCLTYSLGESGRVASWRPAYSGHCSWTFSRT